MRDGVRRKKNSFCIFCNFRVKKKYLDALFKVPVLKFHIAHFFLKSFVLFFSFRQEEYFQAVLAREGQDR